jgi:hypothetical protein
MGAPVTLFFNGIQVSSSFNQDQLGYMQGFVFLLPQHIINFGSITISGLLNNDNVAPQNFGFSLAL